ncbi:SCP-like protein [Ancylostoma duodenale]|uniref:SCP-like protein n=1 Tax=Ancylostoma duodenale TaxID=51022 RepID=A0A0C2G681_9BILA|nr:SCP-like protein [Ancylostoma duodenale]
MLSSLFIWLASASLLGLTTAVSCPGNTNTGMTDTMRDEFLDEHNMRRSDVAEGAVVLGPRGDLCPTAVRMPKLSYDCNLEKSAYEFARGCSLRGSPQNSRPNQGENFLVAPFNENPTEVGIRAINEWFNGITKRGMNRQMYYLQGVQAKQQLPPFTQRLPASGKLVQ